MRSIAIILALAAVPACSNKEVSDPTVGLQPFDTVPSVWLDSITAALEREHGSRVYILPIRMPPSSAITHTKTTRYRADSLLSHLLRIKPDSIELILGVTRHDMSTTKYGVDGKVLEPASRYTDWGVFGLGHRPGHASVLSSFRLGEGHQLLIQRMQKVAVHEIGHNRGLPHCENNSCVMRSAAERLSTIDAEQASMCDRCRHAVH
jgi:archaemetzincin